MWRQLWEPHQLRRNAKRCIFFLCVSFCFQICYQPFKKSLNFRFLKRPSCHSNLPFHQSLWCFHLIFDFLKFIAFESDISQKCLLVPIIKSVSQGTLLPASQIPRSPFSTFSPLIKERGNAFLPLLINRMCGWLGQDQQPSLPPMTLPNSSQLPWDLQCCHLRKKPWLSFYFEAVSIYFFAKTFLSSHHIADAPSAQSSNHRRRIDREQRWENTNRWTDRPSDGERITSGLILLKLHYWFLCGFLCIL